MADDSIVNTAVTPVPQNYTLAGTQQLMLKAVRAEYDGSGAASAWFPACQLIDPAGNVMYTAVASNSIASGVSANANFFPGVRTVCPLPSTLFPNGNYVSTVLSLNPWAFWKLNEAHGSTSSADSSGHGRTLTDSTTIVSLGATNIVPTDADTCAATLAAPAASSIYFQTAAAQAWSVQTLSLEVWIAPGSPPGTDATIYTHGSIASTAQYTWWLRFVSGAPTMQTINGGVATTYTLASPGLINSGTHHVVVTLDGSHVTCYVNGVQTDQQTQTANIGVPQTRTVYINQGAGGSGIRGWPGLVGPCVIYDSTLTAANVSALYSAGAALSP